MDGLIEEPEEENENEAIVVSMGFTQKQAKLALKQTDNNVERAIDYLFSHPDLEDSQSQ